MDLQKPTNMRKLGFCTSPNEFEKHGVGGTRELHEFHNSQFRTQNVMVFRCWGYSSPKLVVKGGVETEDQLLKGWRKTKGFRNGERRVPLYAETEAPEMMGGGQPRFQRRLQYICRIFDLLQHRKIEVYQEIDSRALITGRSEWECAGLKVRTPP
jgi:hypothetical protein